MLLCATGNHSLFVTLNAALFVEDVNDERVNAEPSVAVEFKHRLSTKQGIEFRIADTRIRLLIVDLQEFIGFVCPCRLAYQLQERGQHPDF